MSFNYGTTQAQAYAEGNPYAPLVVEGEARQSAQLRSKIAELVSEVRVGKFLVLVGLFCTVMFCAVTFGIVCAATEYSKEVSIFESALIDRKTSQVVATRNHEQAIENPLQAHSAPGVQWITMMHSDGGLTRRRVNGYRRVKCANTINCNEDGFDYYFLTSTGAYAGVWSNDKLSFNPVEASVFESNDMSTKTGILSGSPSSLN